MKEELLKGLTEEQIAKVKACKNTEEVLAVAREEGIELTDEQLEAVTGGCGTLTNEVCPRCGSTSIYGRGIIHPDTVKCVNCGNIFKPKYEHQ